MARSEAQKAADKRYAQSHKGEFITWTTKFRADEATTIDDVIKQSGMSKADFIRWAVAKYKEQQ